VFIILYKYNTFNANSHIGIYENNHINILIYF